MERNKIKVVIADDHLIFRKGLRKILDEVRSLNIVGEACNGSELVTIATKLKPDIIIVDVCMPIMDGVMAVKEICKGNYQAHHCAFCIQP